MTKPKVTLISHTNEPEKVIASAAKLCYSAADIETLMNDLTEEKVDKFIGMLESVGHASPFEHVSFTFGIEGASRILEQQLTRHRIASYSIQSGRYVNRANADFVVPKAIASDPSLLSIFARQAETSREAYDIFVEALKTKYVAQGMKPGAAEKIAMEDARYVFPNSLETKIIFTMNVRELWNFFKHRCCNRAQWEIRGLAYEILKLLKQVSPRLFAHSGPSCASGICPEGTMQCVELKGKVPTMIDVKELIKLYYNKQ